MKAHEILTEAAKILEERGKLRDTEQGERSMARAVSAFNALVPEKALDEGQGWLFMCCLKMARATAGKPHLDDASDLAGYAALLGEWVAKRTESAPKVEDGWIPWNPADGSESPLKSHPRKGVVRFANGMVQDTSGGLHCWDTSPYPGFRIVAYKVVD